MGADLLNVGSDCAQRDGDQGEAGRPGQAELQPGRAWRSEHRSPARPWSEPQADRAHAEVTTEDGAKGSPAGREPRAVARAQIPPGSVALSCTEGLERASGLAVQINHP